MGTVLSRVHGTLITRPLQRFNIDVKTERVLAQDKPKPAPRYQSDLDVLQQVRAQHPEIKEEISSKDRDLTNRLKQVYVQSYDPIGSDPTVNQCRIINPNRPLPVKIYRQRAWKGFVCDPEKALPVGKVSLKNVEEIITLYRRGAETSSITELSQRYNLEVDKAQKLVDYLGLFVKYEVRGDPAKKVDPYVAQSDWVDAGEPAVPLPVTPVPVSTDKAKLQISAPGEKQS